MWGLVLSFYLGGLEKYNTLDWVNRGSGSFFTRDGSKHTVSYCFGN